jgi:ketosteroid isomerase-like protein
MKRCPTCNRTFTDTNLSFCIDDGTPLAPVAAAEDETTTVSPSSGHAKGDPPPQEAYQPRHWQASDYQPPGFQSPPVGAPKSKSWPWIVGIVAVVVIGFIGLGIAAAIFVPNLMRTANRNSSNANVERGSDSSPDLNSNEPGPGPKVDSGTENPNTPADGDITSAPTDENQVLAELAELEHEWTVANINADKQKLNRILADDYVGMSGDGKNQGKAEYLATIERDTSIEKWDFEDLKVTLKGDRATLTGVIRLQLRDREGAFRFIDKFVWRDGRWQAVGSEVSRTE